MTEKIQARSFSAQPALVWAALITVYVLWGSTYLGIRVAVATIPPFLMAGIRFVIAGLVLCAWRFPAAARAGALPTRDHWRNSLVIGAALLLGGNGGVAYAETQVPSGLTALIVSVVPLWMMVIDRLFYGRRMSAATATGLIVGFGGIALLVGSPASGPVSWVGVIVLVIASLSWAAGSLYSRNAIMPDDSLLGTGMQMLAGGLCLTAAGVLTGELAKLNVAAITPASWIAFTYLVVLGGIVGFSAYLWLIRNAPTPLVSTYAYVNPVVAVILGWAVLHERLGPREAIAGAIVVLSVAWIVSANNNKKQVGSAAQRAE